MNFETLDHLQGRHSVRFGFAAEVFRLLHHGYDIPRARRTAQRTVIGEIRPREFHPVPEPAADFAAIEH